MNSLKIMMLLSLMPTVTCVTHCSHDLIPQELQQENSELKSIVSIDEATSVDIIFSRPSDRKDFDDLLSPNLPVGLIPTYPDENTIKYTLERDPDALDWSYAINKLQQVLTDDMKPLLDQYQASAQLVLKK